jgi:arabinose-5-phosphate isomerase
MSNNLPVRQVMLHLDQFPCLPPEALMVDALESMSRHRLGIACSVGNGNQLLGVFTDGDLRRLLLKDQKPLASLMTDDLSRHLSPHAKTVDLDASIKEAVNIMEEFQVWDLPVVNQDYILLGLLHLHPVVEFLLGDI